MPRKGRKRLGKKPQHRGRGKLVKRAVLTSLVLLVCCLCSWLGWTWISNVPVRDVAISTPPEVQEQEIRDLIVLDSLDNLYELSTADIRSSITDHPWVEDANIGRIPNGTLKVDIKRKTPVARIVDRMGRPGAYLDGEAHILPDSDSTAFNVPLIRGIQTGSNAGSIQDDTLLSELLHALDTLDPRADALLSEIRIHRSEGATAILSPAAGQGAISVVLGHTGFQNKFSRLAAYWEQAVLPSQSQQIREIDLRFDSQIVVKAL